VYQVIGKVDRQLGKVRLLDCPERRYTISDGDLLVLATGGVVCAAEHPHYGFEYHAFDMLVLEEIATALDLQDTMTKAAWYTQ
jgi:hypothetical protein